MRARVKGVITWSCGFCGYVQHHRVGIRTFLVTCHNCTSEFAVGVIFHRTYQGMRSDKLPPAMIIPGNRIGEEVVIREGIDPMTVDWVRDAVLECMSKSSLTNDWTWDKDLSVVD